MFGVARCGTEHVQSQARVDIAPRVAGAVVKHAATVAYGHVEGTRHYTSAVVVACGSGPVACVDAGAAAQTRHGEGGYDGRRRHAPAGI